MRAPDPEFWRGRRVWLTGHSGFKGGWLALWLAGLGAEVHGFGLPPERAEDLFHSAGIGGMIRSRFGELGDAEALTRSYRAAAPQVVLHLAAQPLVRRGYDRPLATVAANVLGTAGVLELCRSGPKPEAVVVVTTDKVYRNPEAARAFVEDDPLGGHDPYSASKAAAEILAESWRASFLGPAGIPMATARAGNVIGGGDFAEDRLVPDAIRAFRAGRDLRLRMPAAVRPWQHVIEPLGGYLLLAEALAAGRPEAAGAFNFGPDPMQFRAVGEVAGMLARLWGAGREAKAGPADPSRPEARHLTLDSRKAARLLGWEARIGLEAALALTVEWYRAWDAGAPPAALAALMRRQIAAQLPESGGAGT